MEIKERLRPWIFISGPQPIQVIYTNGATEIWADFQLRPPNQHLPVHSVRIGIPWENAGTRVAKNLRLANITSDVRIERTDFENVQEEIVRREIAPGQKFERHFNLDWNRWINIINNSLWIGFSVSYDNGTTRCFSGGIYEMVVGIHLIQDAWYT